MNLSPLLKYSIITGLSLATWFVKSPLGLDAYPFSLLYWVIALGTWLGGLRGGLFASGLAIALAAQSGTSPYRCFWFLIEALAIVLVLAARNETLERNANLLRQGAIKDEFFDKSSHGMKGHLTNIRLAVNYLKKLYIGSNPKVQKVLGILSQECDRLTNLVINILKIQRLELELASIQPQLILLKPWLNVQIDNYQPLAEHRGLKISFTAPDIQLLVDPQILEEIISELLLNACKYTTDNGSIVLEARVETRLILEIKNQSRSIDPEELDQLFDRFYRASKEAEGTGLGLAIVLKQVALLRGTIEVQNHFGWTIFQLTLPL